MARPIPFNRFGIFGITSVGTPAVTTTEVTFTFTDHPYVSSPYNGLLLVNVTTAIPTGTTGTLPIVFKTGNVTKAATKVGGVPLTAADVPSTGYLLFFYDRTTGVFEALTSVI